ncbi:hypothetical protein ABZY00_31140 [Streptomyces griseoflavus]|uniref:hypothetical protein n=1 Tax=Streptomyces griseoflavus TaxID=35619 RepID=UPI0033A10675
MTNADSTSKNPASTRPRTRKNPTVAPRTRKVPAPDAVVLVVLLASCAGIYLAVGEAGFAGVISAVAALYGTWRTRR